ncbi:hypothetical protein LPJ61_000711 [Coemansia biformis]|uniref:Mitochondrial ribosomal protein subunit L20-domain-containing protein n=1 Tax=Coemansia biformis TaxID=1286918 RepID=A0A9W7YFQ2_9FUNG|nr:hypothetical protein LPJ61_000711 [Coemansia biformis]
MFATGSALARLARAVGGRIQPAAHMSSAAARKSLGMNVHYTEALEDGSTFVSRVPRTLPALSEADLPPRVREPRAVAQTPLTDELKHAVAKLRMEDPTHWTVSRLARKFSLSPRAVLRTAQCPEWRRQEIQRAADKEWERLGYKKRLIRINRLRRRLLW